MNVNKSFETIRKNVEDKTEKGTSARKQHETEKELPVVRKQTWQSRAKEWGWKRKREREKVIRIMNKKHEYNLKKMRHFEWTKLENGRN